MASENHRRFLSHLGKSGSAVWMVARWLNGRGFSVTVPPTSKAETHSDWKKHADSGDLFIMQRVEVKRLSVKFTCAADWPFGKDFIVCAKHSFDRAFPRPYAYAILSNDEQTVAIVLASGWKKWRV